MRKKISIMLAALSILSVSAVCPAKTTVNSLTTEVAEAATKTGGIARRNTPIKQSASSSSKTIKTLYKGDSVQVFSSRNGYSYVGYGKPNTASAGLGWVKTDDLIIHTIYG